MYHNLLLEILKLFFMQNISSHTHTQLYISAYTMFPQKSNEFELSISGFDLSMQVSIPGYLVYW